jgi:hypothetical protein
MSGKYIFNVPVMPERNYKSYRLTGVHKIEWLALRVRRLLIKEKINFKWRERKVKNKIRIIITWH